MAYKNGNFYFKKGVKYCGATQKRFDSKGFSGKNGSVPALDDAISVFGWFINSEGHKVTVKARQNGKSAVTKENGGAVWLRFKITNHTTMAVNYQFAWFNPKQGTAFLSDWAIQINTSSKNSGWCGVLTGKALEQRNKRSSQSRKYK